MSKKTNGAIRLREYLQTTNLNPSKAEKAIYEKTGKRISRVSLWQYTSEKVTPSRKHAATIAEWSEGAVPVSAWDESVAE